MVRAKGKYQQTAINGQPTMERDINRSKILWEEADIVSVGLSQSQSVCSLMRQVPLECDINNAVNGCSEFATSTQKEPFMAMLISRSRGTYLIVKDPNLVHQKEYTMNVCSHSTHSQRFTKRAN